MKIVDKALYELLKAFAGGRIYSMRAPQNVTAPFVVFQSVDSESWDSINNPAEIASETFQIDIYSKTPFEAKQLDKDIKAVINKFSGTVSYGSDSPSDTIKIAGISFLNGVDLIDETDEPLLFRRSSNYRVIYYEGI